MTDKKDETGKGPAKPGDAPRRPYATIDLQATEVGGKDKSERPAATAGSAKPETASVTTNFRERRRVMDGHPEEERLAV